MITPTKITLSPQELQLVTNTEWILTKQLIMDKVFELLGELCEKMKELIAKEKEWLPNAVLISEPKIFKGENYLKLPYVMLDYPRCFDSTDIFAIRTMFWWGNFFSITIQLSGRYKKMFEKNIIKNRDACQTKNFYCCINDDQWQHHFNTGNYCKVSAMGIEEFENNISGRQFIKIAISYSLYQWNDIPVLLERSFFEMLQLLRS